MQANQLSDISVVQNGLRELSELAARMAEQVDPAILKSAELIANSMQNGGKLLACGNGGSAADAQHFVAEFVGRLWHDRPSLPAVSLCVDPSIVTALGNDYGYENLFARQLEGVGKSGDVLLAISTSGRSANILAALRTAHAKQIGTIALVGQGGDSLLDECDVCIRIPSKNGQRIQELHMAVLHAICSLVETQLGY